MFRLYDLRMRMVQGGGLRHGQGSVRLRVADSKPKSSLAA